MPSASPPAKLRILLIGVQRLLCDALHAMIEADAECTVVGKTTYIDEALTLFLSVRPCLILADLDLRNGINVQLIEQLSQFTAGIPLVLITFHTKPELLRQLLPLNIQACLAKDIEGSELIMTLKLSKNGGGQKILSPSIIDSLMSNNATQLPTHEPLTKSEEQVLALILQDKTNQNIAEIMHLSRQTVRNYVHTLYQKFHVTSRSDLILLFSRQAN